MDGAPELDAGAAFRCIPGVIGRVYLDGRANLRACPDRHRDHVQDDAIEVQKCARAEPDVVTVVAMERWPDDRSVTDLAQNFPKQKMPLRGEQAKAAP